MPAEGHMTFGTYRASPCVPSIAPDKTQEDPLTPTTTLRGLAALLSLGAAFSAQAANRQYPGPAAPCNTTLQACIDGAWSEGWVTPQLAKGKTGKTVAVVGSGPAGMAAARNWPDSSTNASGADWAATWSGASTNGRLRRAASRPATAARGRRSTTSHRATGR